MLRSWPFSPRVRKDSPRLQPTRCRHEAIPLPGEALGGGADVAVGAGSNVVMVYSALTANAQTETVTVPFQVQGLALGDFIWDRDGRTEISVLADDGSIHILQHGTLNTAPLTAAELPARQAAIRGHHTQSATAPNPTALGAWTVAKQLPYAGSAPSGPVSASAFNSPRLAASSTQDLMVLDAPASQLHILDTSGKTASPSADVSFSGTPVAALALPQKINSDRDIVVLTSSQSAPLLVTTGSDPTFTVTWTNDEDDVDACTNTSITSGTGTDGNLSLREAVCEANNNAPSTSTINIPPASSVGPGTTYGLTSLETGELRQGTGTAYSLSIIGTGTPSNTIIQQTDGVDRIFEEDYAIAGNNPVTIENVTLTGGKCTRTGSSTPPGDCTDGGGAIIAGGLSGDDLTLTSVVMSNNSTGGSGVGDSADNEGGAVAMEAPSITITNSTFTSNTAANGGPGGGVYFLGASTGTGCGAACDIYGSMTITNSTFSSNVSGEGGGVYYTQVTAPQTVTITGSTFTGNQANGSSPGEGGAVFGDTEGSASSTFSGSRFADDTAGVAGSGLALEGIDYTVTATDNWWGCNAGPGSPANNGPLDGSGTFSAGSPNTGCDSLYIDSHDGTSLDTSTWLVLGLSADPTQILPNTGTSTLTADLTHNNVGTGGFSVPDGTPVSFDPGGTLGTISEPIATTLTSGQGTATYTAGGTAGNATPTTTVDNATASTTINILDTVIVTTNQTGFSIIVDLVTYTAPQTFNWVVGSPHTLNTTSPQGSGYVFSSWSNSGTQSQTVSALAAETTYTANFTQGYQLTTAASPSGGGSVTTPPSGGYYAPGASIAVAAIANPGYQFTNWTSSNGGTFTSATSASTTFTMPSAATTVTANFQAVYQLTTQASPSADGSVTSPPSGGYYASGASIPVAASANAGFQFSNWTTSNGGTFTSATSASTSFTMPSAATTVTANFAPVPVAAATSTSVNSSNNPSFTTGSGNSVTFTATVSSTSTVNEGTVTFTDSLSILTCSGGNTVAVSGGQAQCVTSFSTEGTDVITATYNGTVNFLGSNMSVTQVVNNHTVQTVNQWCNPGAVTGGIVIPATAGAATPYPSNIFVTGYTANIAKVTVTLKGISSSDMPPTDLLLVGPAGAEIIPFASVGDTSTISGVDITLDDAAAGQLPAASALTSGTFQPTSLTGGTTLAFPGPAPATTAANYAATDGSATLASTFNGTAPNGTWALYAMASGSPTSATSIGSWCVNITPATVPITITTSPANLLVSADGGTFTAAPLVENWAPGSSHTIATESPQSGGTGVQYVWSSWSDSGAISHSITVPSTATTYTATFNTQYQLTTQASPSADGSVTVPTSGGYYASGAVVPVTAAPASVDYQFSNWTSSSGGTFNSSTSASTTFTMPSTPTTVTANFVAATVQITITTSPANLLVSVDSGTLTEAPLVETWNIGSSHTIATTSPQAGATGVQYVWNNWSDSGAISHGITVPSTATTYTASFTTQYQLTTAVSPSGGGTVSPASGTFYNASMVVNLKATPAAGYVFSSWTGPVASASSASTTVTMSAPESVTANFISALTVSPYPSYSFGTVYLGTLTTKNFTVSNTGTTPITMNGPFISILQGGDSEEFVEVDECPKSLPGGSHCTISVTFVAGPFFSPQTAILSIMDNAPGNPQKVTLTATVIDPQASFNPSSLSFGTQSVGTPTTKTVTLKNTGATTLSNIAMAVAGTNASDFTLTPSSNCGSSLPSGNSCTISVTFKPAAKGALSATLQVTDNTQSGKQTVPLSGTGH